MPHCNICGSVPASWRDDLFCNLCPEHHGVDARQLSDHLSYVLSAGRTMADGMRKMLEQYAVGMRRCDIDGCESQGINGIAMRTFVLPNDERKYHACEDCYKKTGYITPGAQIWDTHGWHIRAAMEYALGIHEGFTR